MRKSRYSVYLAPLTILIALTACTASNAQSSMPNSSSLEVAPTTTVVTTTLAPETTTSTTMLPPTTSASPPTTTVWERATVSRPEKLPSCIPLRGNTKSATQFGAKSQMAITVDDWTRTQDTDFLSQLLDIAAALNVRLTLFPTGQALQNAIDQGKQAVWRRAVREGHVIGNHTYDHISMRNLSPQTARSQLQRQQDKLNEVLGYDYPEILMRPPYGDGAIGCVVKQNILDIAAEFHYIVAVWTIDGTASDPNADLLWHILHDRPLGNGGIILLHPQTFSIENFAPLIVGLRDKGYDLVTLNQMVGLSPCAPVTCEPPA